MICSPRSHRRLEVFRRICPDVPEPLFPDNIVYEIDVNRVYFQETIVNRDNGNGIVERQAVFIPAESSIHLSREFSPYVNGLIPFNYIPNRNAGPTVQQIYDIVDRELSDALMLLQISRQNNRLRLNQGFTMIQASSEEIIWNQNHLMNIMYCNSILQKIIHKQILMESLHSLTHLLPEDLINGTNYFGMIPPVNTENSNYSIQDRQTQFTAEEHSTTPLNVYAAEFVVPNSEQNCVDTINLPQINFQDDLNLSNQFLQQNGAYHPQPTLLDHNFQNEFYEITNNINHPQAILQHCINFPNELNNDTNQPQPVLHDCINLPYEFYEQEGAIYQSQPIFLDGTNPLYECSEPQFMNDYCWQPTQYPEYADSRCTDTNISQQHLLNYMNYINEFSEPGSVNLSELNLRGFVNSNEFLNPNFHDPTSSSQAVVFEYMNFNNGCLEQSAMDFQQPNEFSYMNFSNEFTTPYISNYIENNILDCMNVAEENFPPRPILNRNFLAEYQTPDLLQNSAVHETNSTEDYTTEYSLTHAISRPTGNDINNDNFPTPNVSEIPAADQLQYPLRHTNYHTECAFSPGVPRPILNRSYLDEFPMSHNPQHFLNEYPKSYTPQNYIVDHENSSLHETRTESRYSLPVPRPILNRSGTNGCSVPYSSQNYRLEQTNTVPNYTNSYAESFTTDNPRCNDDSKSHSTSMSHQLFQLNYNTEFPPIQKAPRPNFNHVNGFPVCNIPQEPMTSTTVQMNVEPTNTNSEESQISELSELSPNDE